MSTATAPRARQPEGAPNSTGGQFARINHAEPALTLPATQPDRPAALAGWPETLPDPIVRIQYDHAAEDRSPTTIVTIPDGDLCIEVDTRTDGHGGYGATTRGEGGLSDAELGDAASWAESTHEKVQAAMNTAIQAVIDEKAATLPAELVGTGSPVEDEEDRPEELDGWPRDLPAPVVSIAYDHAAGDRAPTTTITVPGHDLVIEVDTRMDGHGGYDATARGTRGLGWEDVAAAEEWAENAHEQVHEQMSRSIQRAVTTTARQIYTDLGCGARPAA
ncbi:hypothetical protein V6N00_13345 [Tersicoccus sp. MR15.9]|uniref:hypothetical protein n=1 Tax=Tersicoccus mangrovi TaxID=3121635 RepID=UPI002FE62101